MFFDIFLKVCYNEKKVVGRRVWQTSTKDIDNGLDKSWKRELCLTMSFWKFYYFHPFREEIPTILRIGFCAPSALSKRCFPLRRKN